VAFAGLGRRRQSATAYTICIVLTLFSIIPILVLISDALRTDSQVADSTFGMPTAPQWGNFFAAWQSGSVGSGLLWSALYVLVSSVIVTVLSCAAAYALVRLRVRFIGTVMTYLLVTTGLPIQSFLVPLFILWVHLHLYGTFLGLNIIYIATSVPFGALLMRSYLQQVPAEYIEAARVEGAGEFRIAARVVAPLVWAGMISVALVTGVNIYNDFIFAVAFLPGSQFAPVSLSFYAFLQGHGLNYSLLAAAGLIVTAPVFLIFLLLQRRFIEGLAASGLK
jgi:raffinose/stachyose/melibiose transport system permease protein